MLSASTSAWKMMKDAPNHITENMIGSDQTSLKIHREVIFLYNRQC